MLKNCLPVFTSISSVMCQMLLRRYQTASTISFVGNRVLRITSFYRVMITDTLLICFGNNTIVTACVFYLIRNKKSHNQLFANSLYKLTCISNRLPMLRKQTKDANTCRSRVLSSDCSRYLLHVCLYPRQHNKEEDFTGHTVKITQHHAA